MARRRAGKANPRSAALRGGGRRARAKPVAAEMPGKSSGKSPGKSPRASEATLSERLAALERECAALREELELERSRRRMLEDVHAATRDRIAWALDSLQAIIEARS
jgi:hypothetical protein